MGQHIVIVGAGYGGVVCATKFAQFARNKKDIKVTLVNPNPYQESRSEIDLVVSSHSSTDFCKIDLVDLYKDAPVDVILGKMTKLDKDEQTITVEYAQTGKIQKIIYTQLILAVGAVSMFPPVPGLKEHAQAVWGIKDIASYKDEIARRFKEALKEADKQRRQRLLTFTIVGAGATGAEIVAPLAASAHQVAKAHGVDPREITINLVDGVEHVLPDLGREQQLVAEKHLIKLGITLYLGSFVQEVFEDHLILQNGTKIHTGALLFAGGARTSDEMRAWDLPLTERSKRIITDDTMRVSGERNIWAIGDCAAVQVGACQELPMLAQHASREGEIVAINLINQLSRRNKPLKRHQAELHGQFVSMGHGYALGWAMDKRIRLSGRVGALMKRMTFQMYWHKAGGMKLLCSRTRRAYKIDRES